MDICAYVTCSRMILILDKPFLSAWYWSWYRYLFPLSGASREVHFINREAAAFHGDVCPKNVEVN